MVKNFNANEGILQLLKHSSGSNYIDKNGCNCYNRFVNISDQFSQNVFAT